jgi:hypothetical protein
MIRGKDKAAIDKIFKSTAVSGKASASAERAPADNPRPKRAKK